MTQDARTRVRAFLDFPLPNDSDLLFSYRGTELRRSDLRTLLAAHEELAEVRAERDALLEKPISLAKMDSVDDDATDRMIAYYWHEQAQEARAERDAALDGDKVSEEMIEAGVKELRVNLDLSEGLLDDLEDDSNLHIALRAAYLAMRGAALKVIV